MQMVRFGSVFCVKWSWFSWRKAVLEHNTWFTLNPACIIWFHWTKPRLCKWHKMPTTHCSSLFLLKELERCNILDKGIVVEAVDEAFSCGFEGFELVIRKQHMWGRVSGSNYKHLGDKTFWTLYEFGLIYFQILPGHVKVPARLRLLKLFLSLITWTSEAA